MSQIKKEEFGAFRSFVWPIQKEELKKVIPMLLMFFCVTFNFNILKNVTLLKIKY